jgi:hypothetical protein
MAVWRWDTMSSRAKILADQPQHRVDIGNLIIAKVDTVDWPWIQSEWLAFERMDEPRMV